MGWGGFRQSLSWRRPRAAAVNLRGRGVKDGPAPVGGGGGRRGEADAAASWTARRFEETVSGTGPRDGPRVSCKARRRRGRFGRVACRAAPPSSRRRRLASDARRPRRGNAGPRGALPAARCRPGGGGGGAVGWGHHVDVAPAAVVADGADGADELVVHVCGARGAGDCGCWRRRAGGAPGHRQVRAGRISQRRVRALRDRLITAGPRLNVFGNSL